MGNKRNYTKSEEIANGLTHGLGIIFGIVALTVLLILSIREKIYYLLLHLVYMDFV